MPCSLVSPAQLILPLSSWAFWAGLLSNATEIHVNAPPLHPVMHANPQYIYHSDKTRHYFGRYNASQNDIVYDVQYDPSTLQLVRDDLTHAVPTAPVTTQDTHTNAGESSSTGAHKQSISYSIPVQRQRRVSQSRDHVQVKHHGVVNSIERMSSAQVLEFLAQAEQQMRSFEAPFLRNMNVFDDMDLMKEALHNRRKEHNK